MQTINRAVAEAVSAHALPEARLVAAFEMWWPGLEQALRAIPTAASAAPPRRPEYELLGEILEGVRGLTRSIESANRQQKAADEAAKPLKWSDKERLMPP